MTDTTATPATQDTSAAPATETETTTTPATAQIGSAVLPIEASKPDVAKPGSSEAKPAFGETWRQEMAGEDAALLKRLERYASPKDLAAALVQAQKKISDGSYKKAPDAKATPEEIAEYRRAAGIPEDAKGYFEKLPDGLVIGDEDKPVFDALGKELHGINTDPKVVHKIADWYYKWQDEVEGKMHEANVQAKQIAEDTLREEWGVADYRQNTNMINTLLETMPEDVREELFQATTPDGKQVMNNPGMLKWLAQQARELNYTGAVLPSGNGTAKSIDSELSEMKTLMADRSSKYWKGPEANKMQARYRELIDLQNRISNRAA